MILKIIMLSNIDTHFHYTIIHMFTIIATCKCMYVAIIVNVYNGITEVCSIILEPRIGIVNRGL